MDGYVNEQDQVFSEVIATSRTASSAAPESVKCIVRVRPLLDDQIDSGESIHVLDSQSLSASNTDGTKVFQCSYDAVLGPSATQEEVYKQVSSCTESVLDGFNSTIFAYGQTGSGKTHTMFGPPGAQARYRVKPRDNEFAGVIPRAIDEIFRVSKSRNVIKCSIYCSFIQIYNENLFDMLRDPNMAVPLTIREDQKEIYVQGLSEYNVKSIADTLNLLGIAEENRVIRETHMNQFSSRSHSIFQMFVEQRCLAEDGGEISLRAKFNLVDLAGSEKWNIHQDMRNDHISEMNNINLSLHTLGRCISALGQKANNKEAHVPYRESKLTRLLQDSIGGNARTCLIATISASKHNAEESISTLKFADRAKQVMVMAVMNETRPIDHAMVKRLQQEIVQLKALVKQLSERMVLNGIQSGQELSNVFLTSDGQSHVAAQREILLTLETTISTEKEKSKQLELDNEKLKKELTRYRSRGGIIAESSSHYSHTNSVSPGKVDQYKARISAQEACLAQSEEVLLNLASQNAKMFDFFDAIKNTIDNFFSFAIEEDGLQAESSHLFASILSFRNDQDSSKMVQRLLNSIAKLKAIDSLNERNGGDQSPQRNSSVPHLNQSRTPIRRGLHIESSESKRGKQQLPSLMMLNQHASQPSLINSPDYSQHHQSSLPALSGVRRSQQKDMEIRVPLESLDKNMIQRQPHVPSTSSFTASSSSSSKAFVATSRAARISGGSSSSSVVVPYPSQVSPRNSSATKKSFDASRIYEAAGLSNSTTTVPYRVRGSIEESEWVAPVEIDEEDILKKELAKAQKKLKKQQQLQEWLKEKEDRAMNAQLHENEERRAMQEAEEEKEKRRLARVKQIKKKLNGYRDQIKTEAEKIQELLDIGIDPTSLL